MSTKTAKSSKRGKLTAEEIARIDQMVEELENPTAGVVARALDRDHGTIHWHMMTRGYLERAVWYPEPGRHPFYVRGTKKIYWWTREQDQMLVALRLAGLSVAQIGVRLTDHFGFLRNAHSVDIRLKMLAAYSGGPEDGPERQLEGTEA